MRAFQVFGIEQEYEGGKEGAARGDVCGGTRDRLSVFRLSIRTAPLDGLSCLYAGVAAGEGKKRGAPA